MLLLLNKSRYLLNTTTFNIASFLVPFLYHFFITIVFYFVCALLFIFLENDLILCLVFYIPLCSLLASLFCFA